MSQGGQHQQHSGGNSGSSSKFIASVELRPEMVARGFCVDKYLGKLARLLDSRGVDCKVIQQADADLACATAVKENRVFLTSNLKVFNSKQGVPRGCLHYQDTPFN
jgi:uncharacterized protein with PIN domain